MIGMLTGFICAVFVVVSLSIAGIVHVFWLKSRLSSRLSQPLDLGLQFRGRRVFGENKMLRGLLVMPVVSALIFALLGGMRSLYPDWLQGGLWGMQAWDYTVTGFACGLGFMLGELPNSFLKRQLDVPPGGAPRQPWLRPICFALDRLDSTIGALIALSLLVEVGLWLWIFTLLLGPLSHAFFSTWLHRGRSARATTGATS